MRSAASARPRSAGSQTTVTRLPSPGRWAYLARLARRPKPMIAMRRSGWQDWVAWVAWVAWGAWVAWSVMSAWAPSVWWWFEGLSPWSR